MFSNFPLMICASFVGAIVQWSFSQRSNPFNPVLRIWDQALDTAKAHGMNDKQLVRQRFLEILRFVQLDPNRGSIPIPTN